MHALFDIMCVFALGFFVSRVFRSRRRDHVPRLLRVEQHLLCGRMAPCRRGDPDDIVWPRVPIPGDGIPRSQ